MLLFLPKPAVLQSLRAHDQAWQAPASASLSPTHVLLDGELPSSIKGHHTQLQLGSILHTDLGSPVDGEHTAQHNMAQHNSRRVTFQGSVLLTQPSCPARGSSAPGLVVDMGTSNPAAAIKHQISKLLHKIKPLPLQLLAIQGYPSICPSICPLPLTLSQD